MKFEIEKFESQKNFEIYLPHNNLESILNYLDIVPLTNMLNLNLMSSKKIISEGSETLKNTLIRYMFHPQVYFERFCGRNETSRHFKKSEKFRS